MNFLKWLIYIPIVIIALILINLLSIYVFTKVIIVDWNFWRILIVLFIFGGLIRFVPAIIGMLSSTVILICPNRKIGTILYVLFCVFFGLTLIISFWITPEVNEFASIPEKIFGTLFSLTIYGSGIFMAIDLYNSND